MRVANGYCNIKDAFASGRKVAKNAISEGGLNKTSLVLAFCSGQLDHDEFFRGLQSVVGNETPIIGGSAIGIITNDHLSYEGYPAGAAVIQLETLHAEFAVSGELDKNQRIAGQRLSEKFSNEQAGSLLFVLYDSISVPATSNTPPILNPSAPLLEGIRETFLWDLPIVGAGLIGDYAFGPTRQFCGSYVGSQSLIGVLLKGDYTPYIRIMHGCTPLDGIYHKLTRLEGSIIYELDGRSIVDMIDDIYGHRDWHNQNPVNLLTIGVNHGERFDIPKESNYVNRLITGVLPDGKGISLFEPDLEPDTEIQFMFRDTTKMIESARRNTTELMEQIKKEGKRALLGLYIDCAGRTAKESNTKTEEASEVQNIFNQNNTPLFGFYSGVEIAPLFQNSRGLDWTGVLLVLAK